ncbi:MAG: hypothetical protein LPK47_05310 [Bacteroidota bacterium]|nr:hypothetical protein [Bacteroidota bacterium]
MEGIIHSISGPRNISTALMYSFAQRTDTTVVDEPFYGVYLKRFPKIPHPGRDLVLESMPTDPKKVLKDLPKPENGFLYIKNMAHHLAELPVNIISGARVFFLIRHPRKLIASFQKVMPHPNLLDIGIGEEYRLMQELLDSGGDPLVVDTEKLASNPKRELPRLCQALGIPWVKEMLSWEMGPKPYDGVWAPWWYKNVHRSRGFQPFSAQNETLNDEGERLLDEALPYYEQLMKFAL